MQPTVSDPDAHPGRRLPHVWLPDSVGPLSTLDLVGTEFTLLHGQATEAHWRLDTDLAVRHGLPVTDHAVSTQRRWDAVAARCGLTDGSALLVRPDGHIAWCTETSPPAGTLSTVLDGLLAR